MSFAFNSMLARFRDDEDGVGTAWSIFWLIVFLAIGGLAVDSANARRNKEILQTAADSAAHAAVLEIADLSAARAAAVEIADINLAMIGSDDVLAEENILFGTWDSATDTFTETETNPDAVKVYLSKTTATGNAVPTFLLGIVGFDSWDVSASSIVMVAGGGFECFDDDGDFTHGVIANGDFNTKSFNTYSKGMCVHGQSQLNMWRQNTLDDDVHLTTNTQSEIDYILTAKIPHHTATNQDNLRAALEQDSVTSLEPAAVVSVITAIQGGTSSITADYVTNTTIINKTKDEFNAILTANTLLNGRIYNVTGCTTTSTTGISVPANRVITGIVLVTDCRINFLGNNTVTNSIISTKNTTSTSISGVTMTFGVNSTCSENGDTQVLTAGSMSFGKNTVVKGSKLVAKEDITFTSTSGSANGAQILGSLVAAGDDIFLNTTGTNHPTMSSTYNAHVLFWEPYTATNKYYDTWFGQDYIGATFQGCDSGSEPMSTTIVG